MRYKYPTDTTAGRSPEYYAWCDMRKRCYIPHHKDFQAYGGRGIFVYEPWLKDFDAFFEYMGPRPSDQHSLDRLDSDGPYVPGNVRWATKQEQRQGRIIRARQFAWPFKLGAVSSDQTAPFTQGDS